MSILNKSIEVLELPAVLKMLSSKAVSDGAREKALNIRPVFSEAEVLQLNEETNAAFELINEIKTPPLYRINDVRSSLVRASKGGLLNVLDLNEIKKLLIASNHAGDFYKNSISRESGLNYYFEEITTNRFLEKKLSNAITDENEVSDSASPELAQIRRKIRSASGKIRDILQSIIASPSYSKMLQENIITSRSGRFVLPVKAEYKNSFKGLVHDISSSGATLFIEPLSSVNANNEIRELKSAEKIEIERILYELSADCAEYKHELSINYEMLISIDLIFAKAKLAIEMKAAPISLGGSDIRLREARHPLIDYNKVVPINLSFDDNIDSMIITGPNTGGKTVTLKTLGLLALMTYCGLFIPADASSALPVFDSVYADIGDEQSIAQSLSTFSSHMKNICEILNCFSGNSLILLDELGAGTDPAEGAALAISIVEYVRKKGAKILATTHYNELKLYALNTEGISNASLQFDVDTLMPTYKLIIGIPGSSNAFAISSKLGLKEEIISDAAGRLDRKNIEFEDTVNELNKLRSKLEEKEKDMIEKLRMIEKIKYETEEKRKKLSEKLSNSEALAREEAGRILSEAKNAAEDAFREIDKMRKRSRQSVEYRATNDERSEVRRKLNEASAVLSRDYSFLSKEKHEIDEAQIEPGDIVKETRTGVDAEVIELLKSGELLLGSGNIKFKAPISNVKLLKKKEDRIFENQRVVSQGELRNASLSSELDLRGMNSLDAISALESYLDNAIMSRLNVVTVIHGKGSGTLRKEVNAFLKQCGYVKRFRLGKFGEGEHGVTVVELSHSGGSD